MKNKISVKPVEEGYKVVIQRGNESLGLVFPNEKEAKRAKKDFQAFLKNGVPFDTMYRHAESMYFNQN